MPSGPAARQIAGRSIAGRRIATPKASASGVATYGPDIDANAYLANAISATPAYKTAITKFVVRLKAAGAWAYLKAGYIFANPDAGGALVNIANPSQYLATLTGSPAFTPYKGYAGPASGQAILFNMNAAFTGAYYQYQAGVKIHSANAATDFAGNGNIRYLLTDGGNSSGFGLCYDGTSGFVGRGGNSLGGANAKLVYGEMGSAWFWPKNAINPNQGGSSNNVAGSVIRIAGNYPTGVPLHAGYMFYQIGIPTAAFQAALDIFSDLMEDLGALV